MSVSRILLAEKDLEYGRAIARAVSNLHREFEIKIISLETHGKIKLNSKTAYL